MPDRDREQFNLESELRALTPSRRPEFTAALGARVRSQLREARPGRLRLGLALAVTSGIVVALASLGGIGYAASVGRETASAVRDVVTLAPRSPRAADASSADSEYNVSVCHRT